ncbi:hypothetical protein LX15_004838 [Streptoalloteichus tenebrarius]|uniref:VOC domain-containing protein n=1 Tax=Streptoalloteichus tenebrarius (strain ATCC 17920 / DSM 40477 / JCM 4838 / CBS 697.72 / NBRC 16177 / NCIMB 11028 / NRRL B-12390 / A12253. 1 / ISP 5477) TaxID=1933 RepID=A0ABT1I013_STRSD|nr:VOC family protein [Streptoalloteichus tenebrarius]MCP2261118.1 hypothetical protein [Streptoalloteichus tenebrarius]BFF03973.1 VOC family protein [Streptoalloteichus tenebrarius]
MPRPVHFEIHASDVDRVRSFYETVFGWSFEQWGDQPYWIVRTGEGEPGIDGGLLPRPGPPPADDAPMTAWPVTVGVADLDASLRLVESAGGRIAMPRSPVPTLGWVAYAKDPDGNTFGLFQPDPNAA